MRIGRRRRNYTPVILTVLVAFGIFALVYYVMGSSLRSSPVYSARKVLYVIKRGSEFAFVLIDSDSESVKILYTSENLYDPETGMTLDRDPVENYAFFKDVFGVSTNQWRFLDLSGEELKKFSRAILGREVSSIRELLRGMKKRGGFFDIFIVGKVTKEISDRSNLDNSSLLKLLEAMRNYDLDERVVRGITSKPVVVKIEGEGEHERMYLDSREKRSVREFLGVRD